MDQQQSLAGYFAGWAGGRPARLAVAAVVGALADACLAIADVLSRELKPAPDALSSVLTCCDMTTSPDGELVPVEQQLAEIHDRYGPGHLVSRSIQRATPMILGAVEVIQGRAARPQGSDRKGNA